MELRGATRHADKKRRASITFITSITFIALLAHCTTLTTYDRADAPGMRIIMTFLA